MRHPVLPLRRGPLGEILERILTLTGLFGSSLELRITSDKVVTELHCRHMGGVGPTNVLSFPAWDSGAVEAKGEDSQKSGPMDFSDPNSRSNSDVGPHLGLHPTAPPGLGSIVLSADAVLREAFLYGQPIREHFIRLLTHALLHLAGYEHGQAMDDLTEHVLEQMQNKDEP